MSYLDRKILLETALVLSLRQDDELRELRAQRDFLRKLVAQNQPVPS